VLDAQSLFSVNAELIDSGELRGLDLVMGFTGSAEAGQVVRQLASELLEQLDGDLIASFDADQLIDYRGQRPVVSFVGDHFADYERPRIELHRLRDGMGRPFLFLTGSEPDLQWERFCRAVTLLAVQLEVKLVTWVQSLPMPVPHTRPIGVTVHGNQPELIDGITSWKPTAQVQASIGTLLEIRLIEAGLRVAGYSLHVPHYLADAEYPQAAVAAMEYLGAASSLVLPTDRLREAGLDVGVQIAKQVSDSAEVQGVVTRLEKRYDEYAGHETRRSLLTKDNDELPDADELGSEVEAFLAGLPAGSEDPGVDDGQDGGARG
jgi:PAC2 family